MQATAAFHSRTIENRIAAEKQTKTRRCRRILSIIVKLLSKPHDVISAVDENHFAGNTAAGIGGKKNSRRSDLGDFNVPSKWSALFVALEHLTQA